jgi:hypothetical protein
MSEGYRVGDLDLVEDLGSARWVINQVKGFAENVGSLVPSGFASYGRVLHPAYRQEERTPQGDTISVTWGEVARANGRVLHPEVQFASLVGRLRLHDYEQPGLWDTEPEEGSLPANIAARMAAVLYRHTATPNQCWFAVWDGWGDLAFRSLGKPTFQLPGRRYFLFSGSLAAANTSFADGLAGHRSANLWWPNDRAWCVATEVDLNSTYVGGSGACIAELVATPGVEAVKVKSSDGIIGKSDETNPPPTG